MQSKWKNGQISTNVARKTIYLLLLLALFSFRSLLPVAIAVEFTGPEQIILTWTGDPASSQTISWLMPGGSPAQVQYIEANVFNGSFNSARQVNTTGIAFDSIYYRYTANITGLTLVLNIFIELGEKVAGVIIYRLLLLRIWRNSPFYIWEMFSLDIQSGVVC